MGALLGSFEVRGALLLPLWLCGLGIQMRPGVVIWSDCVPKDLKFISPAEEAIVVVICAVGPGLNRLSRAQGLSIALNLREAKLLLPCLAACGGWL
jgi:hypothetical protein